MSKYIDLIICEDKEVLMAPAWSYIKPGDVVMCDTRTHTAEDSITVGTDSVEYRFICEMEPNIQRIDSVWIGKSVKWEDDNGSAE